MYEHPHGRTLLQPHWVKRGRMRRKWQPGTIVAEVDLNTREVKVNNLRFEKEVYDEPHKSDSKIARLSVDRKRYENQLQSGIQSQNRP